MLILLTFFCITSLFSQNNVFKLKDNLYLNSAYLRSIKENRNLLLSDTSELDLYLDNALFFPINFILVNKSDSMLNLDLFYDTEIYDSYKLKCLKNIKNVMEYKLEIKGILLFKFKKSNNFKYSQTDTVITYKIQYDASENVITIFENDIDDSKFMKFEKNKVCDFSFTQREYFYDLIAISGIYTNLLDKKSVRLFCNGFISQFGVFTKFKIIDVNNFSNNKKNYKCYTIELTKKDYKKLLCVFNFNDNKLLIYKFNYKTRIGYLKEINSFKVGKKIYEFSY